MNATKCNKCGGSGKVEAFKNIANGVCFDCDGTGGVPALKAAQQLDSNVSEQFYIRLADGQIKTFTVFADGSCFGPNFSETRGAMREEARSLISQGGVFV